MRNPVDEREHPPAADSDAGRAGSGGDIRVNDSQRSGGGDGPRARTSGGLGRFLRRGAMTLVVLALPLLWALNCSGPRPSVAHARLLAPPAAGMPYQAMADVHNDGPGHGTVQVTFYLRDTRTGRTYESSALVTLDAGETETAVAEIPAPPATYDVRADAEYPIR